MFIRTFSLIENPNEYDPARAYCFRFTWLGPQFDNESLFQNATCEDIIGESATVPCNEPLIATSKSLLQSYVQCLCERTTINQCNLPTTLCNGNYVVLLRYLGHLQIDDARVFYLKIEFSLNFYEKQLLKLYFAIQNQYFAKIVSGFDEMPVLKNIHKIIYLSFNIKKSLS